MARSRSYDRTSVVSGENKQLLHTATPIIQVRTCAIGKHGQSTDSVGLWDVDNPLTITHYDSQVCVMDGKKYDVLGRLTTEFVNLVPTVLESQVHPSSAGQFPSPNYGELAWAAAAGTMPGKAGINLPAFIGESGDIPGMLTDLPKLLCNAGTLLKKQWTRGGLRSPPKHVLPRKGRYASPVERARKAAALIGSQYVGAEFGWKPLVGDLVRLLGLQKAVQANLDLLERLMQGRSIKRRVLLPTQRKATPVASTITHSDGATIKHSGLITYWREAWVTARWSPTFFTKWLLPTDPDDVASAAMRMALGMTSVGLFLASWELLPWSWLIDWWANIGRYLAVYGNAFLLQLSSLCYMQTDRTTRYWTLAQKPDWVTFSGPGDWSSTCVKTRVSIGAYLLTPLPFPPFLPVLTGRQAGILSGIAAQFQAKYHR